MTKLLILTVTLLGLTLSTSAIAQQAPEALAEDLAAEETEAVRYYSVEVVVFEYTGATAGGNEIFDPEPTEDDALLQEPLGGDVYTDIPVYGDGTMATQLPSIGNAAGPSQDEFAKSPNDDNAAEQNVDIDAIEIEEVPSLTSIGFRLLEPEELSMMAIHQKLLRLDAYQPLVWGGWVQAAVDEETTLPVQLRMLGTPPLTLSGELTLYLKNYLHLVVDLGLQQRVANIEPVYRQQASKFGDRPREKSFGDKYDYAVRDWQVTNFLIEEDRIFNSGHLRYFDHPKFGALVRVNRVEFPENEDLDGDDPDASTATLDAQ